MLQQVQYQFLIQHHTFLGLPIYIVFTFTVFASNLYEIYRDHDFDGPISRIVTSSNLIYMSFN